MKARNILFFATTFMFTALVSRATAQVAFEKPDFDFRTGPTLALDLNGDGITDFATAVDGAMIIYLNPGGATIGLGTQFPAGPKPIAMIAGDFNGDGVADLAELGSDGSVTVLLGNGDGTFSGPVSTATGATKVTASISANDFNGDGLDDVAFTTGQGNVFVLVGNGDGSFNVRSFASGAPQLNGVDSADYDGDGKVDLAVLTCCRSPQAAGDLQIMHGHGDGTFGSLTEVAQIGDPTAVTTADLNNDGHPDLLVSSSPCIFTPCGRMDIFMNRGDGTFIQEQSIGVRVEDPSLPAVGDFNGDGIPDIAFQDRASVLVFLGNGDGTFGFVQFYATGPRFQNGTMVGDFNPDGILDLVTVNANGTLTMLTGNGDGTFFMSLRFPTGLTPAAAAAADFNGDGIPDLVVSNSDINAKSVSVLLGNGDGTFQPKTDFSVGNNQAFDLATGDFNGDGRPDVAVVNQTTVTIMLNDGSGSLAPAGTLTVGNSPVAVAVADFNGDGNADLAVTNSSTNTVSIFLGNGDGSFSAKRDFPTSPTPGKLVVADFNGDGIMDLAVTGGATAGSRINILLGNGDGTFRAGNLLLTFDFPVSLTAGDFNGDGITDLAWVVAGAGSQSQVQFVLGNGNGTFGPLNTMPLGGFPGGAIRSADINGDGVADLVVIAGNVSSPQSGDVVVYVSNGDGTFQSPMVFAAAGFSTFGVVADFDGNGLPDIAVVTPDPDSPVVSMLLNRSQ